MSNVRRTSGYLPIQHYGVIGDGRSVALIAPDGSIDWWCAPSLDSAPIFRRIIDNPSHSCFRIDPVEEYESSISYIENSNVIQITYSMLSGSARVIYSLNSGSAGRLPWSEFAVKITDIQGNPTFNIKTFLDNDWSATDNLSSTHSFTSNNRLLSFIVSKSAEHVRMNMVNILYTKECEDYVFGIIVTDGEPQLIPDITAIDHRIDLSIHEWQEWSKQVSFDGTYNHAVTRSALALKLLLYSPSGAIAAAGTTSLPEKIGGDKNYDYRFAWIRDTAYTIKAFSRAGMTEEVQAALAWLLKTIRKNGIDPPDAFYTLMGETCREVLELPYEGYESSKPVQQGNPAAEQLQLSVFGDILETIALFVNKNNLIDPATEALIVDLLASCEKLWRKKDAGIWELPEQQHYTLSKIGCWLAFQRGIEMCKRGTISSKYLAKWQTISEDIYQYIETECWNEEIGAYTQYAGGNTVDASLMLATRFGYPNKERLKKSLGVIKRKLCIGPYVYRYEGSSEEEGAFVACSYWLVEGYAFLGMKEKAVQYMDEVLDATTNSSGLMSEMVEVKTGEFLGNIPQGLSHLAMIHAADSIEVALNNK